MVRPWYSGFTLPYLHQEHTAKPEGWIGSATPHKSGANSSTNFIWARVLLKPLMVQENLNVSMTYNGEILPPVKLYADKESGNGYMYGVQVINDETIETLNVDAKTNLGVYAFPHHTQAITLNIEESKGKISINGSDQNPFWPVGCAFSKDITKIEPYSVAFFPKIGAGQLKTIHRKVTPSSLRKVGDQAATTISCYAWIKQEGVKLCNALNGKARNNEASTWASVDIEEIKYPYYRVGFRRVG